MHSNAFPDKNSIILIETVTSNYVNRYFWNGTFYPSYSSLFLTVHDAKKLTIDFNICIYILKQSRKTNDFYI